MMTVSRFAWAVTSSTFFVFVILVPLVVPAGTLYTLLNSTLSEAVYPEEVGGTLGISALLESLAGVQLDDSCWGVLVLGHQV